MIEINTPEDLRRQVLLALIQVRYDRPVKKRGDPIYTKELRKYLPDSLTKWDLLNAVRFLRKHSLIQRIPENGYGWNVTYLMNEQTVKKICFTHGMTRPCPKCLAIKGKGIN